MFLWYSIIVCHVNGRGVTAVTKGGSEIEKEIIQKHMD